MKILTLNTWTEKGPWQARWEIIFRAVRDLQPDIFAFQEVFNPLWAEEVREKTKYPFLVYSPDSRISGLGILSRFPVLRSESFELKAQSQGNEPRRFLLFAELETEDSKISVFNTHLTWRLDEGQVRQAQVDEILERIEMQNSVKETILCGDFNSGPDTPELKKVINDGFIDTYNALNPGKSELTWDNANPYAASASVRLPDRRIDFIFSQGIKPKMSQVVLNKPNENGIFASDHYGILTGF